MQSANGFARAVSAPLAQVLITGVGWRGAYLAQGGFMAVAFLPLALLFRRNEPAQQASQPGQAADDGWTLSHRDEKVRAFWIEHAIACRKIGADMGR